MSYSLINSLIIAVQFEKFAKFTKRTTDVVVAVAAAV
jgi:hypothetical protein